MSRKEIFSIIAGTFLVVGMAGMTSCTGTVQDSETGEASSEVTSVEEVAGDGSEAVFTAAADSYDFGKVSEGEKVEHEFVFTNTGTEPLIIQQVSASCGCTTPEYSRNPIAPGAEGRIKVVFDSEGQLGQHHKVISVATNAVKRIVLLHLRGEVIGK